ncbi:hypothetical protein L0244_32485 [bacterium]|nr:hypothetical protein [bacterium]
MMRSPELEYCLQSPYLWYDETSATLVPKDLENAEKLLKEAQEQKDPIQMLNKAYQSMYCATMALLHSIRYKASGFRCIVTVLQEYFVQNGKLQRVQVDNLIRAQKLLGTPQENFEAAGPFLEEVKKILGK